MKAFILTSFLRSHNNQSFLEISGVLESGEKFIFYRSGRDVKPYFYRLHLESRIKENDTVFYTLNNKKVIKTFFNTLDELRIEKRKINKNEIFESDIDYDFQFLNDHSINGMIEIIGEPKIVKNNTYIFHNNGFKKTYFHPHLKMFSFDIETNVKTNDFTHPSNDLYSISVYSEDHKCVLMLDEKNEYPSFEEIDAFSVFYFQTEKELLEKFIDIVHHDSANVFVGWNIVNFDFQFIIRKASKLGIQLTIGNNNKEVEHYYSKNKDIFVKIPGKIIVDGMQLVRLKGIILDNYKLDTAASHILGQGKTISLTNEDKVKEINHLFLNNKRELARYNYIDSKLVYDLIQKIDGVNFLIQYNLLSTINFDRFNSFIDVFEGIYLKKLHTYGYVANDKSYSQLSSVKEISIVDSHQGFMNNVFKLSIKEFESNIIRFFYLDYFANVMSEKNQNKDAFQIEKNVFFDLKHAISSNVLDYLFSEHEKVDSLVQKEALHTLIHHFTKGMLNRFNRFYSPLIHRLVYEIRDDLLLKVVEIMKNDFNWVCVLEKDKDLFFRSDEQTKDFSKIILIVNEKIKDYIQKKYGLKSSFNWYNNGFYEHFFVHRNDYALLHESKVINKLNKSRFNIGLLKLFQDSLLKIYFEKKDVHEFVRQFKDDLKKGNYDQHLIYKKKISLYQKENNNAPHMVAARKMKDKNLLWVEYVITKYGADPIGNIHDPIDYDYYIEKYVDYNVNVILGYNKNKNESHQMDLLS